MREKDSAQWYPFPGWLRVTAGVVGVLLVLAIAGGFWLCRAAQHVPNFYQATLDVPIETLETAGDELEAQLLNLHNQVQDENVWQAEFTEQQINGWLAVDLPKLFPQAMTDGMSDPRVSITDDHLLLACRIDDGNIPFVASMDVGIFMTDQPNTVGIRIHNTRVGAVPGLTNLVVDQIRYAAWRSRVRLKWAQQDGDPVALVAVPGTIKVGREIRVDSITLKEGRVILTGKTAENPSREVSSRPDQFQQTR